MYTKNICSTASASMEGPVPVSCPPPPGAGDAGPCPGAGPLAACPRPEADPLAAGPCPGAVAGPPHPPACAGQPAEFLVGRGQLLAGVPPR